MDTKFVMKNGSFLNLTMGVLSFVYLSIIGKEFTLYLYCWKEIPVNYLFTCANIIWSIVLIWIFYRIFKKPKRNGINRTLLFPIVIIFYIVYTEFIKLELYYLIIEHHHNYFFSIDKSFEFQIVKDITAYTVVLFAVYSIYRTIRGNTSKQEKSEKSDVLDDGANGFEK